MSFMIYPLKCKRCGYKFDTAFGISGTMVLAQPAKMCPRCKSKDLEEIKAEVDSKTRKGGAPKH